jgi:monoamine oxidase
MPRVSRRSFLAASAALIAAPAVRVEAAAPDVDVAIVGAGAAGIAAARRIAAAKRSYRLIEASSRIGGRCAVDGRTFGIPFDLGAHWIYNPDSNPLLAAAPKTGLDIYAAPRAQAMRIGPRAARDSELENFLATQVRAQRALAEAGKGKVDVPAQRALPKDLGPWQPAIEFMFGPYAYGKDLAALSAFELARAAERENAAFCRQGYGAVLAQLASGLSVQLSNPVSMISWVYGQGVTIETPKGDLSARTVILTVSTGVLASDAIEFIPPLPKRQLDAANKLSLGSLNHIALDMPGNPLALQRDDVVFEQSKGPRTAALLANIGGTGLHVVEVGGTFGRELAAKGEAAMTDFAAEWIGGAFGANAKRAIKRSAATRWDADPLTLGAMSTPSPGASEARKALSAEPLGGRVWFAGEALHETQWGTVNGAWESGVRAAEAALRKLGVAKDDGDEKPARRKPKSSHRRRD